MTDIGKETRVRLLTKLRDARYLVLRDAEAIHEAATTLEYVGQIASGEMRPGLGKYKDEILRLAVKTGRHSAEEIGRLFRVVREARNDAVHVGAHARHLNTRVVELILILEEAIMAEMQHVQDLMVRAPVVAEPWQLLAHVRNTMLTHSFSGLPIRWPADGGWKIITDTALMKCFRTLHKDQKNMTTVAAALEKRLIQLEAPSCVRPDEPIVDIIDKMNHVPILVTDSDSRLLGLLTSFDLL